MNKQKWEDSSLQKKKIYNGVASEYDMPTNNVETLGRWQDPTIEQLQQENKQLKEELKDEEQWRIKIAKERDELHKECLNHIEQKKLYKEVIEEVRKSIEDYQEYIDEAKEFYSDLEDDDVVKVSNLQLLNNQMVRNYELLQILDKVKEVE